MPVLTDLLLYLQAQGLGTPAVTLFAGGLPQDSSRTITEDALIALVAVPGLPPMLIHNQAGPSVERAGVQVLVRGSAGGEAATEERAYAVWIALASIRNQTISGMVYLSVMAMQSPFLLRRDESNRPIMAFNLICSKGV